MIVLQAGFPFFQLDRFLKTLVQDFGKYVAISEEFPNDASGKAKSGGLLFDRRVTRIVTPGTLVDEKFIDPYENNFLLAVYPRMSQTEVQQQEVGAAMETLVPELGKLSMASTIGLAWLDLSTGEFFTQTTTSSALSSEVIRIGAKEILLPDSVEDAVKRTILSLFDHKRVHVAFQSASPADKTMSAWSPMMESPVTISDQARFTDEEVLAGSILLHYVKDRLFGLGVKLQPPVRRQERENMGIDRNSMRGLEILETARDAVTEGKGSLLHAVRRTVTRSGARVLRERICK